MEKLYQVADIYFFIYLSSLFIIISFLVLLVMNLCIPPAKRTLDNVVIGNTSAFVSIIYGVLMGLMSLYLIDNVSLTANSVQKEANSAANLYRDTFWLSNQDGLKIRKAISSYLNEVINIEWPTMRHGEIVGFKGNFIIDNISILLKNYPINTQQDTLIIRDMLDEIKNLYDARHWRIYMSHSSLSPQIWIVIFVGTFLTLGINFLFGTSFFLHSVTIISAALMCASMIYLLATLDRPFQGEFIIEPTSLISVSKFIKERG